MINKNGIPRRAFFKKIQLDRDFLSGAENLTKLVINAAGLEPIPFHLLRDTKKLKRLEIRGNHLTALPDLSKSTALEKLVARGNKISALDSKVFLENRNLKELDLSRNKLSLLPATIFSYTPLLKVLDLSNNSLKIPDTNVLGRMINLKNVTE